MILCDYYMFWFWILVQAHKWEASIILKHALNNRWSVKHYAKHQEFFIIINPYQQSNLVLINILSETYFCSEITLSGWQHELMFTIRAFKATRPLVTSKNSWNSEFMNFMNSWKCQLLLDVQTEIKNIFFSVLLFYKTKAPVAFSQQSSRIQFASSICLQPSLLLSAMQTCQYWLHNRRTMRM